jgi:hypothetical protein
MARRIQGFPGIAFLLVFFFSSVARTSPHFSKSDLDNLEAFQGLVEKHNAPNSLIDGTRFLLNNLGNLPPDEQSRVLSILAVCPLSQVWDPTLKYIAEKKLDSPALRERLFRGMEETASAILRSDISETLWEAKLSHPHSETINKVRQEIKKSLQSNSADEYSSAVRLQKAILFGSEEDLLEAIKTGLSESKPPSAALSAKIFYHFHPQFPEKVLHMESLMRGVKRTANKKMKVLKYLEDQSIPISPEERKLRNAWILAGVEIEEIREKMKGWRDSLKGKGPSKSQHDALQKKAAPFLKKDTLKGEIKTAAISALLEMAFQFPQSPVTEALLLAAMENEDPGIRRGFARILSPSAGPSRFKLKFQESIVRHVPAAASQECPHFFQRLLFNDSDFGAP